mgnify:CR=1 FL=1
MPYIHADRRDDIDDGDSPKTIGELTYKLTKDCLAYLDEMNSIDGAVGFADYAFCIAALEATKLEFYRRIVVPHEETRIQVNGDVFPPIPILFPTHEEMERL